MAAARSRLEIEQGGRCFYCSSPAHPATTDHVLPRSAGGPRHFRNEVLACLVCGQVKADRLPTDRELRRLIVLKRRYAEVDYQLALLEPETQTDWLEI